MRVGLVADTLSIEKGTGIARYCGELLKGLAAKGVHAEPIAPAPPGLPFGVAINHALRMPYLVRSKAHRFDLVHATSPITALAFPLVSTPKIVTYHDLFSLLCESSNAAFHTRLFAPLFLRIGQTADRIIAVSCQTKAEMIEHLGIPPDKIRVVNYGVSDMFRLARTDSHRGCIIGYVGTLERRKGVDYLLRVVQLLKARGVSSPLRLAIYGSTSKKSPEYPALRELVKQLDLSDEVEFKGFQSGSSLVRAYNSFDVLMLPSEWEGFGLPILEAQACGVPVIIRRDAHIPPEVSRHCVLSDSVMDAADRICELLTDSTLRKTVIEKGLEYSQQFTWSRVIDETLAVYEEALG
ncbi:MAG: glycosyltransferase [Anaerolineae bacterium]|nr:glycosyltransferase [Anaerolineae bacterium]NIN93928.1 glycosyltransferase [Anaerolineae bacterium]NIQ76961.1 glycosyltransferase [Anaerolineae bacterium]